MAFRGKVVNPIDRPPRRLAVAQTGALSYRARVKPHPLFCPILAALLAVPSPGAAEPLPEIARGVTFEPMPEFDVLVGERLRPAFVDASGRAFAVSNPGGAEGTSAVLCLASGTPGAQPVLFLPADPLPSAAVTLAVSDDGTDVRVITHADQAPGAWAVWRIACDGTVSDRRAFTVPPDDPVGPPGFETARLVGETLVYRTAMGLAQVDLTVDGARPTLAVNLESVNLTHCLPLPAGDLLCGSMGADGTSLVRIGADGGIETLVEPRGIGPHAGGPMVLDRQRGLVFFPNFARNVEGDVRPVFGVLRLSDSAFGETAINADWPPVMSLNETIFSSGELLVLAHDPVAGDRVGRIVFDETHVDLDRDTLTATRELELGTSDWSADSDGDGVDDGVELALFETSPTDAASRPPRPERAWRYGPSTRLDLERRTEAVFQPQRRYPGVPAYCEFTPDGLNLDCSDLGRSEPVPAQVRFDTVDLPSPDFRVRFRRRAGPDPRFLDGFERYALEAATPNAFFPFPEAGVATVNSIVAVSADTLYLTAAVGPGGATRLWRLTADGGVELDPGSGCPLAPPDDACPLRYDPGRVIAAELVGVDAERGAAFLRVETAYTTTLGLLALDGVRPLRDLGWSGRGARVVATSPFVDEILISDPGHAFSGGRRAGADWAGERFVDQSVGTGGVAPFATGFGDDVMLAWLVDDAQAGPGGGCFSIGGLRACDIAPTGATAGPKRIPHEVALIWQPIEEALTPGEVLFGGFADGFDEATGAQRPPRWAVWKMTRTGAVTPWLDAAQFDALVQDPLAREDLAAHPLDHVDSLAVASNGLKFCFVERTFGRGWEVTLDPVRRVPASAAPFSVSLLGPSGGALACAYDERDRLAVVGGAGVAVGDEPARPHALGNGVKGLLRTDEAWIAWGAPGPAVCLGDDGTTGTRAEVAAVTPLPFLPGHVAWIAPGTRAREIAGAVTGVATVEAFCTGADANEALEEPVGINLWDYLQQVYVHVTYRRSDVVDVSLVARPDGSFLLAGWNRTHENGEPATELWGPEFTYLLEPAFRPYDAGRRIAALDPFRRARVRYTVLVGPRASPVERTAAAPDHKPGALALVPGASPDADWGHVFPESAFSPEGGWPSADPGETDAGADGDTGAGGGEGCACRVHARGVTSAPWLWPLVGLAALRRRRHRKPTRTR
jgi:hypothetical protein